MSNKRPREPVGPSLLVTAARTPGKSEQLEGLVQSGFPPWLLGTDRHPNSSCPSQAAGLKGRQAQRLNVRQLMRRGRHDNCLAGNNCLKPALLIGFPLYLLRTKARGLEAPSVLQLGGR